MPLSVRRGSYIIPSYTMTGDLLAYLNCGLQYRYHNKGKLPPAIPVQQWFGEFVHGVLEEAYRRFRSNPGALPFPLTWKPQVWEIEQHVFQRLRAQGLWAPPNLFDPKGAEQRIASRRIEAALNVWGPHLFPLIAHAEVRLQGIRQMPQNSGPVRADYYEVQGIVDVISELNLQKATLQSNPLVSPLTKTLAAHEASGNLEVIVDYKGMRRPPSNSPNKTYEYQAWQVRTYAWLREQQPASATVAAGILLYLNELTPSSEDMEDLRHEVANGLTDVPPDVNTAKAILAWRRGNKLPDLPLAYRQQRCLRIVPVNASEVSSSLNEFDQVVADIEASVLAEMSGAGIIDSWKTNPVLATCVACDARTFCPNSLAPGVRSAP